MSAISNSKTDEKVENSKEESKSEAQLAALISLGKDRGYITYDELNDALPKEKFSSQKIDIVVSSLSDMGIQLIEAVDEETCYLETFSQCHGHRSHGKGCGGRGSGCDFPHQYAFGHGN